MRPLQVLLPAALLVASAGANPSRNVQTSETSQHLPYNAQQVVMSETHNGISPRAENGDIAACASLNEVHDNIYDVYEEVGKTLKRAGYGSKALDFRARSEEGVVEKRDSFTDRLMSHSEDLEEYSRQLRKCALSDSGAGGRSSAGLAVIGSILVSVMFCYV